jgi:quercetin dioxygenase-like cupin family protein
MPIYKFDGKDVKFTPWSEVLGVEHLPGSVQYLFTTKQCKNIGATIEKWGPCPPTKWNNDYDEAWYVISGKIIVESEGKKYEYKAGDFGMATKGSYTLYVPEDSKEDLVVFVVHCPPTDALVEGFKKHSRQLSKESK